MSQLSLSNMRAYLSRSISSLNTNAQTFDFLGFTVNYADARVRTPLANGSSVELEGLFSNFHIIADEIKS